MILITRPKNESLRLKKRFDKQGFDSVIDSLSSFHSVPVKSLNAKNNVILTSSPRATQILIDKKYISTSTPLLVIGGSSLKKLRSAGYRKIIHTALNSKEMFSYLKKNKMKVTKESTRKIIYCTSSVGNNIFQKKLETFGAKKIIIYKTLFKKKLNLKTVNLIKKKEIKICVVFSKANADHLVKLLGKHKLLQISKNIKIIGLSRDISNVFSNAGFRNCYSVKKPSLRNIIIKTRQLYVL